MKTRAKLLMVAAGVVVAPFAVAIVLLVGIPLFQDMSPKPSVAALKAQGKTLVDAVERYRAEHGEYPPSLEAAGASALSTGYGHWEYRRDAGGGFYLKVGDYDRYNFLIAWDYRNKRWYFDS